MLDPIPQPRRAADPTYLQNLQLLQSPLHQLLLLPLIGLGMMFPKRIFGSPPGVFSEVIRGELGGLAEEGSELFP